MFRTLRSLLVPITAHGVLALACSSPQSSQSPRGCPKAAVPHAYFAESQMIVSPSCEEYLLEREPGADCARTTRGMLERDYAPLLALLAERPLAARRDGWALRVLALPSFNTPWLVRFDGRGDQAQVTIKWFEGACSASSIERRLTVSERRNLLAHLNAADLFSKPTLSTLGGLDGTTYLVELADPRGYRVLNRWSPNGAIGRLVSYVAMLHVDAVD